MDPFVLQALVGFTGPVSVDVGVVNGDVADVRLTEQNTAQFLLFDQYTIEDAATRTDMLEQVAELVIDDLLDGALPGPTVLGRSVEAVGG